MVELEICAAIYLATWKKGWARRRYLGKRRPTDAEAIRSCPNAQDIENQGQA